MPVTLVQEDQEQDASGNLVDVYVITYTIPGRAGNFTLTVPQSGDPVAAAQAAISEQSSQVNAIYGI